jgi:NAD-dependent SIR2 family protein deacetylase
LYLSRRKFDATGALTEVQCSSCKEFKVLDEYAKNRTQIDGLEHKCNPCKASK